MHSRNQGGPVSSSQNQQHSNTQTPSNFFQPQSRNGHQVIIQGPHHNGYPHHEPHHDPHYDYHHDDHHDGHHPHPECNMM